jgi:hypothetical protein
MPPIRTRKAMKASRRNVRAGVFWRYSFHTCTATSWGEALGEREEDGFELVCGGELWVVVVAGVGLEGVEADDAAGFFAILIVLSRWAVDGRGLELERWG